MWIFVFFFLLYVKIGPRDERNERTRKEKGKVEERRTNSRKKESNAFLLTRHLKKKAGEQSAFLFLLLFL